MVDKCEDVGERDKYPIKSSHDVVPTFRPQLRVHLMATKLSNDTGENSSTIRMKKPLIGFGTTHTKYNSKSSFGESLIFSNKKPNKNKVTPKRKKIKLQERVGNGGSSTKNSIRRMDTDATNLDYVDDEKSPSDIDFFDARTRKKWNLCKRKASQKERKIDDNPSDLGLPVFEHFPIRELGKHSEENSKRNLDLECRKLVQRFVAEKSSFPGKSNRESGKKKAPLPMLTPKLDRGSTPSSFTRMKGKTILNDELRKQIELQDLQLNTPIG